MKKNRTLSINLLVLVLIFNTLSMSAQSLHAIICCNTIDVKIGCAVDEENILNELAIAATVTGLDYKPYVMHGEECTKGNLINTLNNLSCQANDIIFMYYSGHGGHSSQQMNEPFPQMCMKYNSEQYQNEFVSVKTVDEIISKKNPRLSLIVTDCCNNVSNSLRPRTIVSTFKGATIESNTGKEALKKLFIDSKGKVKITSSKVTQYSAGSQNDGGLFTNAFIDVLLDAENGEIKADWNVIVEKTKNKTLEWSQNKQEPYYEIQTGVNPPNVVQTSTPNIAPAFTNSSAALNTQIQYLLDKRISESTRLNHVPTILNNYFTIGAKVKTVGRNLSTIIAYEDAEEFLRRITASPYIKSISIVKQADSGKNNEITVHEIRIQ